MISLQGVRPPLAAAPGSSHSTPRIVYPMSRRTALRQTWNDDEVARPGSFTTAADKYRGTNLKRTIIVALHRSAFTSIHCRQSRQRTLQAITLTTSIQRSKRESDRLHFAAQVLTRSRCQLKAATPTGFPLASEQISRHFR